MPRAKGYKRRIKARTAHSMARVIESLSNKAPRLPQKWKAPSSPKEARKWLQAVADHLLAWPNASVRFRFVGYALKKYIRDPETRHLYKELGLAAPDSKRGPGRPQVDVVTVRGIAKMSAERVDIPTIRETFPSVSKTTVDRIRTDSRALACVIQASHRMDNGDVREKEWKAALRRAQGVRPEWRDAIILGWSDAIGLKSLIDPIDPANPFAPLLVDPLHRPELVRGKLEIN